MRGCELNSSIRRCVVEEKDGVLEHLVDLQTMSLGEDATDELHVVAVESKNMPSHPKPIPIASLRRSVLPMVCLDGFDFTPPVTFILKSGTGPVYLNGQHLFCDDYSYEDNYQPDDDSGAYSNEVKDPNDFEEDSQVPDISEEEPPDVPEAAPPETVSSAQ
ncbi:hypothetical protein lerEdw1_019839 [Lerista edwardsae]|nr:hypothetical protein lerEdw1_019839 [Lerista edwardsae]